MFWPWNRCSIIGSGSLDWNSAVCSPLTAEISTGWFCLFVCVCELNCLIFPLQIQSSQKLNLTSIRPFPTTLQSRDCSTNGGHSIGFLPSWLKEHPRSKAYCSLTYVLHTTMNSHTTLVIRFESGSQPKVRLLLFLLRLAPQNLETRCQPNWMNYYLCQWRFHVHPHWMAVVMVHDGLVHMTTLTKEKEASGLWRRWVRVTYFPFALWMALKGVLIAWGMCAMMCSRYTVGRLRTWRPM